MKNISLQQSMTRYNFLTRPSLIYANQINFPYSNNFSSRSHYRHKKRVEVDKISSPRAQNSINSWVDTSLHRVEGHANNKRKSKQHFSSSFLEMYFSNVASLLKFKWKKSLFASPPHARGVWLQLKCIREIDKQKKSIKIQFFLHLSDAFGACIHTIKYECFSFSHLFIIKQIIEESTWLSAFPYVQEIF